MEASYGQIPNSIHKLAKTDKIFHSFPMTYTVIESFFSFFLVHGMLNFLQWLVIIIIIKITNHVNQASKLCALNYKHLSFIRTYIYFLLTMVQTLLRKLIFFCTKRINILVVSRILGILGKRLLAIKSHDGVYISLRRKIQELTLENHPAIFWNKCQELGWSGNILHTIPALHHYLAASFAKLGSCLVAN